MPQNYEITVTADINAVRRCAGTLDNFIEQECYEKLAEHKPCQIPTLDAFLSNTYLIESIGYTQIACEDISDEVPIECIDDITIIECSLDSFNLERLTGQLVKRGDKEFVDVAEQSTAEFTITAEVGDDCDLTERQIVTTVADVIVESIENGADATDIDVQTTSEVM
jgi:hypothetical protein